MQCLPLKAASTPHLGLLQRCRFPRPGTAVVCAVSGGADSLALLALATAAELHVTAVHVDHGLRPGSEGEADVVREAAVRFGADFRSERVTIAQGPNIEARARAARYGVLPPGVLTGHTADDQAETVLLNLLRGSGLDGLAGMNPDGDSPSRPLLSIRRSETVQVCNDLGLVPVVDPSNADPHFRRNRVRHELLPLINDISERDMVGLLARQAAILRSEADLLNSLAGELDPTDAIALAEAPVPLARRAVRRWLAAALDGRPPDAAAVERVLAVANGHAIGCEINNGVRITRHHQRLRITRR